MHGRRNAKTGGFLATVFIVLICFALVKAERLPLKLYTSADGLASSAVTNVARDSRGFLWFTTRDGLSRFDGREFVNFRVGDNAAAQTFWALHETRDGWFWISTSEGLYRVKPSQTAEVKPDSSTHRSGEPAKLNAEKVSDVVPTVLFEDSAGRLWGGAGDLYLIAEAGQVNLQKIDLGASARGNRQNPNVVSLAETADGSLWVACAAGIARMLPGGKMIFYPVQIVSDYEGSRMILADRRGRIWLVHGRGLFVFTPEPVSEFAAAPNFAVRSLLVREQMLESVGTLSVPSDPGTMLQIKLSADRSEQEKSSLVNGVFQSSEGKIWIAAREEMFVLDGENYRRMNDTSGFPNWTGKIVEDANGDFWIGTTGVLRFSRSGLTSYATADGLSPSNIQRIQQAADGTIYFLNGIDWRVSRITESGIESARLNLPGSAKMLWTSNAALIDRNGDWWALAENGLYRFAANPDLPSLSGQKFVKIYGTQDGLKGNSLYCAFEDSKGNIWFSTRGRPDWSGLTKYDPQTGKFQAFMANDGFPEAQSPVSFAEDKSGNLWFGLYGGGLLKYRDGRFTDFSKLENLPQGGIFGLYVDEKNRLWIGTSRDGVSRVDDPSAEKPEFVRYTTAEGLISNNVRTLVGDFQGNIYAGTVRGVSRIAPETGNVKNFTTADGLTADFVVSSFRDRSGTLWFGTTAGVSKLEPESAKPPKPAPRVWISGLNIAGNRYAVSEFGQAEIAGIEVGADKNNLQIEFLSVSADVRFRYKLEGAENSEWSSPTVERRVNFANLAPDSYKFLAQAIDENGQASEIPAQFVFKINPPFYQSWWFLTLTILAVGGAVFALDRYRVKKTRQVEAALAALRQSKEERLAELERVRTRIATDLHDDIGASLTQIAVLSEVARSQFAQPDAQKLQPLERISSVSNELVETMSDIVWAINPRKDNLRDLVQRMRRFAADILSARGIKLDFASPQIETRVALGANLRREIFALFKEAVTNIAKHSGAMRVEISLRVGSDVLHLQISDDGKGFDQERLIHDSMAAGMGGNGLVNIERRGRELGGACRIISFAGGGTTVLLEVPLNSDESEKNFTNQTVGQNGNGNGLT